MEPDESQKKEVIDEARTSGATVHFASLMDVCHLKNATLEAKHPKYKGRVVLRGDILKDDPEPTSFLDHVYLGCTQRQCEISKDIVDNYRAIFESRISTGGVEKLPFPENLRISSLSYDMAGHAKKCVERYCELANKTTQQLHKVSTPCIDDHHFKEEENEICWRIATCMVSNCSEMLIFGKNWTT